jgi:bacterioferritin-associated ferredoxin
MPHGEIARLNRLKLVLGMPVETFVQTSERTVMSYLVKPLHDQDHEGVRGALSLSGASARPMLQFAHIPLTCLRKLPDLEYMQNRRFAFACRPRLLYR